MYLHAFAFEYHHLHMKRESESDATFYLCAASECNSVWRGNFWFCILGLGVGGKSFLSWLCNMERGTPILKERWESYSKLFEEKSESAELTLPLCGFWIQFALVGKWLVLHSWTRSGGESSDIRRRGLKTETGGKKKQEQCHPDTNCWAREVRRASNNREISSCILRFLPNVMFSAERLFHVKRNDV